MEFDTVLVTYFAWHRCLLIPYSISTFTYLLILYCAVREMGMFAYQGCQFAMSFYLCILEKCQQPRLFQNYPSSKIFKIQINISN